MPELPFRHVPAHLVTGVERGPDIRQVIFSGVISQVSERHVGVEELQRFFFLGCDDKVINLVKLLQVSFTIKLGLEVFLHLVTIVWVVD